MNEMQMYEEIRFLQCADLVLQNHGGLLLAVTSSQRQGTAVIFAPLSDLMPMPWLWALSQEDQVCWVGRRCRTR